jgi:hypothetical protein
MIVAIVALVFATTGGAYAATRFINGSSIKNGTISAAKLSRAAKQSLEGDRGARGAAGAAGADGVAGPAGQTGAKGDTGAQGERGAQGEQGARGAMGEQGPAGALGETGDPGEPGQALIANRITPPNDAILGIHVLPVQVVASNAGDRPNDTDDTELVSATIAEPGQYIVQGVAQFIDVTEDTQGIAYGVTRLFVGGQEAGEQWTSDIPDDGDNLAQASGTTVIDVTDPNTVVSVRAVVRSDAEDNADGGMNAGANLVVTKLDAAP